MAEAILKKLSKHSFIPASEQDEESLSSVKVGDVIKVKWSRPRHYGFHKKYFALLNYSYDIWEPPVEAVYKGEVIKKNFDRFREDIQILAGFGYPVVNINGEVRYRSDSISFGSMEQEDFEKLYSSVFDVVLERILVNYTKEELDNIVNNLMGFL